MVVGGGGESKKEYFVTHENDTKFKFQYPSIKFYWNTLSLIIVQSYFSTTRAELDNYNRDNLALKASTMYYAAF